MNITAAEASEIFRKPPDRFLDVGAGQIAYRRVGTGPDVLFSHGWPVHSATFRRLLPHLADKVTCHLIDYPGAGSSTFDASTPLSIDGHIESLRKALDLLDLRSVAVVGHDSGGLIARHALAGDPRVRAFGLIDTEPLRLGIKFRSFIMMRRLPAFGAIFGWLAGQQKLRKNRLILGDAFADPSLLDGEFDEFFLRPLHESKDLQRAAVRVLKTFDYAAVRMLPELHKRIDVPVQLVWGEKDRFFPVASAKDMVASFSNARLAVIAGAGLFSHEERPAEVAAALLPTLLGT